MLDTDWWAQLRPEEKDQVREFMAAHGYDLYAKGEENPLVCEVDLRAEAPMLVYRYRSPASVEGDELVREVDEVPLRSIPPRVMLLPST